MVVDASFHRHTLDFFRQKREGTFIGPIPFRLYRHRLQYGVALGVLYGDIQGKDK